MDIFHKMCANFYVRAPIELNMCVRVDHWTISNKTGKNHLFCGVQSNRVLIAIDLCFLQNCRFLVEICLYNPINVDLNHRDLILQSNNLIWNHIEPSWLFANTCPIPPSSSSLSLMASLKQLKIHIMKCTTKMDVIHPEIQKYVSSMEEKKICCHQINFRTINLINAVVVNRLWWFSELSGRERVRMCTEIQFPNYCQWLINPIYFYQIASLYKV